MVKVKNCDSPPATLDRQAKFHLFHRYGDVHLTSKDGIIFRIDGNRLKDIRLVKGQCPCNNPILTIDYLSPVFALFLADEEINVPIGSKRKRPSDANDIVLPFLNAIIDIFINLISVSTPHVPEMSWKEALTFLESCRKYHVNSRIVNLVHASLSQTRDLGNPWIILIWASQRKDITIAEKIPERMTTNTFLKPQFFDPIACEIKSIRF
ncbi:uncharacterized protein IL334_000642 [Kwoniella shivajii]|uniref:BTB domain-containing protein n=1 Tax=Kwoniella shivajii TaxID=564305 RepID=A0ABZ1CQQ6_9TREE|nr:hypothetical protein IL334_000642 [Kwoniella shivajii]